MHWGSRQSVASVVIALITIGAGACGRTSSGYGEVSGVVRWAREDDRCTETRCFEKQWGGAVHHHEIHLRVQRLISDLSADRPEPQKPVRFALLRSPQRAAFSLHPDRIYISEGLYQKLQTDRLLAAVLAHELAHLHEAESAMSCIDGVPPGLAREMAADERAAQLLHSAGYRASDLVDALGTVEDLQPAGWFEQRAAALRALEQGLAVATADRL